MKKIILASASKRRSEILSSCNIPHEVIVTNVEELHNQDTPISKLVLINAERKAMAAKESVRDTVIIGADTLVINGRNIMGKPKNKKNALELLMKFSGNGIEVYTGICVIDTASNKKALGFSVSKISVVKITKKEAENFLPLLGPYDKAGGFSIEGVGSMLFDDIKGSYFNVLGLPMAKLRELFNKIGLDILDFVAN